MRPKQKTIDNYKFYKKMSPMGKVHRTFNIDKNLYNELSDIILEAKFNKDMRFVNFSTIINRLLQDFVDAYKEGKINFLQPEVFTLK